MNDDIYKALMDIKEGQGRLISRADATHEMMAQMRADHKDLDNRVTALEHLKITIIATATAIGGVFGLFWEKIKAVVGHLIA